MFDGLLAPWHLLILAVVVFVVVGPRKIVGQVRGTASSLERLIDADERPSARAPSDVDEPARPKWSYRLGRRLRRRR